MPWKAWPARPEVVRAAAGRFVLAVSMLLGGCTGSKRAVDEGPQTLDRSQRQLSETLLVSAIGTLNHLEEFSGEMLLRVVERLNQWLRVQDLAPTWQPDSMVRSLPPELAGLSVVQGLGGLRFARSDAFHLQEVLWFREVSQRVRGEQVDDLARATQLFDWTIRNLQLTPTDPGAPTEIEVAWQVLQLGRATARQRAWVMILLCRQQGLPAVLLEPEGQSAGSTTGGLVGVLCGGAEAGKLYLFDTELGLPIPGPGGNGVATLSEAAEDETVLRQLDLDAEHVYPRKSADLQACRALIEASPGYLARRMQLMEAKLSGQDRMVLTVHPTREAEVLARVPHVAEVRLWTYPYEVVARSLSEAGVKRAFDQARRYRPDLLPEQPPQFRFSLAALQKGRVLHIKGRFTNEGLNANQLYQAARPATVDILTSKLNEEQQQIVVATKQDASYWLGLLAYERGSYETAADFFLKRTLEAWPDGPWTAGARYNLARVYEATGRPELAAQWLEADDSPQRHGNLVRARRLRSQMSGGNS